MQEIHGWVSELTGLSEEIQNKILTSLLIMGSWGLIRWLIHVYIRKRQQDLVTQYNWRKTTSYLTYTVVVLMIAIVWVGDPSSFATFLGLFSAGLAIALKDPVANVAGWFFIIWRKPLQVGDRIEIKGLHAGDVIDVRLFQFTIIEIGNWVGADQSTGRLIHMPNAIVFTKPISNYNRGFDYIWNEVKVLITFESDWEKAKELLFQIIEKHALPLSKNAGTEIKKASQKYLIFYRTLTPTVYTSVEQHGVSLTMRYLCPPRKRRGSEQAIWEDVLAAFQTNKEIHFAYPTQRFVRKTGKGEIE